MLVDHEEMVWLVEHPQPVRPLRRPLVLNTVQLLLHKPRHRPSVTVRLLFSDLQLLTLHTFYVISVQWIWIQIHKLWASWIRIRHYLYRSGSLIQQAKKQGKPCFLLFLSHFLSLKNDVNVLSKSNMQKDLIFLLASMPSHWRKKQDPDPEFIDW